MIQMVSYDMMFQGKLFVLKGGVYLVEGKLAWLENCSTGSLISTKKTFPSGLRSDQISAF